MLGDRSQAVSCRDHLGRQLVGPSNDGVYTAQGLMQFSGPVGTTYPIRDDLAPGCLQLGDVIRRCFTEGARPDQYAPLSHR